MKRQIFDTILRILFIGNAGMLAQEPFEPRITYSVRQVKTGPFPDLICNFLERRWGELHCYMQVLQMRILNFALYELLYCEKNSYSAKFRIRRKYHGSV